MILQQKVRYPRIMITLRTTLLAISATLASFPASADPTTYRGKLGNLDIVVELTADPATETGAIAGRYFYLSKGVDIPLRARGRDGRIVELGEEEACGEPCRDGAAAPIGAVWRFESGPNGRLTGTWKGKRELKLVLERAGSRFESTAPKEPLDLFDHTESLSRNGDPISLANEPYDRLRVDVPMKMDAPLGWAGARYAFARDPRIGYAFPRIVELSGAPAERANEALEQLHWRASLSAFSCAALQYAGFTDGGVMWSPAAGSFGGWDTDAWAEVVALTPRLLAWTESGSRFCGGAHPFNYYNAFTMDVATGEVLTLGDMFTGATDTGPGEALANFVRERRPRPQPGGANAAHEEECGTDELIGEFLSASLRRDGDDMRIVFGLEKLPHVITACGDDLLDIPAAEARHLMTPRLASMLGL